jgi:protocatechuate 3,4-dioxygenase beta subunit
MKSILIAGLLAAGTLAAQASIEGQVFNAATGAPLKKVMVRLNGLNAPQQQQGPQQQGRMPTMLAKETDDQGTFSFTGLEAGRYSLAAQRTGFLRQSYGSRHYNTNGTPLILTADQHVKNLVFKLSPQSVIAGKVLDEDGDPMSGVQVRAMRYVYRNGKKQWSVVGNGQTSDIGEYRISNLEPGRYVVATNPRNYSDMVMTSPSTEALPQKPEMVAAPTYYPNAPDSTTAAPLDVGPGAEARGIDVRVRKVEAFRVRGKVSVQGGGADRQTVTVMLTPKDGGEPIQSMGIARQPENRFEIRGVPPGSYLAHAQLRTPSGVLIGFQPVEIAHGHVDGLVLTLAGGFDLQGVVKVAESDAQVTLQNINVNVRPVGFLFGGAARGKVGDDNKFTLKGVMPERFTVNVQNPPDGTFVKSILYGGQEVTDAGVEPNGNAALEIILSATAGQLTGVVSDKDGKPVAGALVALYNKATPTAQPLSFFADENGSFTFKGLKPGDYRFLSWEDVEPGAPMDPEFVKPWESRAAEVKIDPSGKQTVQFKVISAEETAK